MARTDTEIQWTILSLIQWSEGYLADKGVESPRLNAELLLAAVLGCKRIDLYTRFDKPLLRDELDRYKPLFIRRANREPLQYILGEVEFYGRTYRVRPGVLIPRPETEHLIESAIEIVNEAGIVSPRILDVGTGSGCVAITLAAEIDKAVITAIDNSKEALTVAAENAGKHSLNGQISFKEIDILAPDLAIPDAGSYDLIVANPPYIPLREWETLADEVKVHEPKKALTDNGDGLTYIKRLAGLASELLKRGGWLLCEIGHDQSDSAQMIFRSYGTIEIRFWRDLSGIKRIIGGNW